MAAITSLRTQYPDDLIGVDDDVVRLSWQIDAADAGRQTGSHIQVSNDPTFDSVLAEQIDDASEQLDRIAPGDAFASRERRHYRVKAELDGVWTDWSPVCSIEIGLLTAADWSAKAVTLPDDPGGASMSPSPLVRKAFDAKPDVASARLHVTSLGVHRVFLNGQVVSDDLLAPGWSAYHQRLVAVTHDVTDLVTEGENVLSGSLGDGWYRGRLGWNPGLDRCNYGTELGLFAQLEVTYTDGSVQTIATDDSWRASTGSIRFADIYDGCEIDLAKEPTGWTSPGFDDADWSPVALVELDPAIIEPWISTPIRPVVELEVSCSDGPNGVTRVDVGQNISGYLAIEVAGAAGVDVVTHHAEVVEAEGALHLRALRSAIASDRFVLADDQPVTLVPEFTFHGFRYADIKTDAEILSVRAIAISSDLDERSSFVSSHAGLNQFESNVRWSQRDNFVGLPTDCPQRDERLGWTGDAQAFAPTANVLFDSHQFWLNWFRDLSLEQTEEGVPSVVPNVVLDGEPRMGRAGWADVATIAPWAAYEATGSTASLSQQLDSMVRWVATLRSKRHDDGLLGGEFQFGDWLDPDAPAGEPWKAKADGDFIANSFFVHSARLTAQTATVLGETAIAGEHFALADEMAALTWARWGDHARTTQTGCAVVIELGIAPAAEHPAIADVLASLVREAEGAVSTGFLGTPLVLPALSRHGHFDTAYLMLLRTGVRSWLYQVENGATTVWERWDAIKPDGSIHEGTMEPLEEQGENPDDPHMLSFNHYAYGACIDWVYRNVGGLSPDVEAPGYRHTKIAPKPCTQIISATTTIATGYGDLSLDWAVGDDRFTATVTIPFGSKASFDAPATDQSVVTIDGAVAGAQVGLGHGTHTISVTHPAVASPS